MEREMPDKFIQEYLHQEDGIFYVYYSVIKSPHQITAEEKKITVYIGKTNQGIEQIKELNKEKKQQLWKDFKTKIKSDLEKWKRLFISKRTGEDIPIKTFIGEFPDILSG